MPLRDPREIHRFAYHPPLVDPEAALPAADPGYDYPSVFTSPSPTPIASRLASPIRLADQHPRHRPSRSPSPTSSTSSTSTTAPSITSTAAEVLATLSLIARAAFHLTTFTAGLYLSTGTFSALAPLLSDSLALAPAVFVACALVTLLAPFWGLLIERALAFALSAARPARPKPEDGPIYHSQRRSRRRALAVGAGLAFAAARILLILATLASTILPCHDATLRCAGSAALSFGHAMAGAWERRGDVAPGLAVALVPLAAAWWYTSREGVGGRNGGDGRHVAAIDPEAHAGHTPAHSRARDAFVALKAACVFLAAVEVWVVLALGGENRALRDKLAACRAAGAAGGVRGVVGAGGMAQMVLSGVP